jgi:hypothetical protein
MTPKDRADTVAVISADERTKLCALGSKLEALVGLKRRNLARNTNRQNAPGRNSVPPAHTLHREIIAQMHGLDKIHSEAAGLLKRYIGNRIDYFTSFCVMFIETK